MTEKDSRAQFNMPYGIDNQNEKGIVQLHESVIAAVVKNAACSVDGVIRLAGTGIADSIAGILGTRKKTDGSIKVELTENSALIEVSIIVAYGMNIPELAMIIQTTIIDEVKNITGLIVSNVDVIVQDVDEVIEEKTESDDENKESEE